MAIGTGGSKWGPFTGLEVVASGREGCVRSWLVVGREVGESAGTRAAGGVLGCRVGFENIATLTTSILEFGSRLTWDKSVFKIKVMLVIQCCRELTTMYLYVGPPKEIHHHVWLEALQ